MVKDIQEYFAAWNNFASNPDEGAQKVNLINKASVLTASINRSSKMLYDMHTQIDETIKININEINSLGKQITISIFVLRVRTAPNLESIRETLDWLMFSKPCFCKAVTISLCEPNFSSFNRALNASESLSMSFLFS